MNICPIFFEGYDIFPNFMRKYHFFWYPENFSSLKPHKINERPRRNKDNDHEDLWILALGNIFVKNLFTRDLFETSIIDVKKVLIFNAINSPHHKVWKSYLFEYLFLIYKFPLFKKVFCLVKPLIITRILIKFSIFIEGRLLVGGVYFNIWIKHK